MHPKQQTLQPHHGGTETQRGAATTKALRSGDREIGRSGDLEDREIGSSGNRVIGTDHRGHGGRRSQRKIGSPKKSSSSTLRTVSAILCCLLTISLLPIAMHAQTATVTGSVEVTADRNHARQKTSNAGVVVWLTPMGQSGSARSNSVSLAKERFTLLQKNKTFAPHVLVVPVGAEVVFPNKDPFFHNVFSLFDGKRFDLGLYESGTTRSLRFDQPGISYLFCNIHPEMSAVIIALDTPYYGSSNAAGQVTIPSVPVGQYILHVWKEGSPAETLKNLSRTVFVSSNFTAFEKLQVPDNASFPLTHKNKYGRDYENPTPPGRVYIQP